MARRYPHRILPAKENNWPSRVLCVDAIPTCHELMTGNNDMPFNGHACAVTLMRMTPEGYQYGWQRECKDNAAFWTVLSDLAARGRSFVVLSVQTEEQWAKLGLWRAMETGQATMNPDGISGYSALLWAIRKLQTETGDYNNPISLSKAQETIEYAQGYLCLSNPPLIARFKIKDQPCWITWVDSDNYGLTRRSYVDPGMATAQWLGGWLQRYSACCHKYALGKWCPTAGGQASYGWKYGYYSGGVSTNAYPESDAMSDAGYYGGRVECYAIGPAPEPCYCFDTRAAYCAVASWLPVPTRLRFHVDGGNSCQESPIENPVCSIARVSVRTDEPAYPVRRDGLVFYPVGTFTTTLAGPELKLAFDRGHVTAVHEYCDYDCEPVLKDFAWALTSIRDECDRTGDDELAATAKRMINSLCGRFARRNTPWVNVDMNDNDLDWGTWTGTDDNKEACYYRSIGGQVQRQEDRGYDPEACPAIAAWITSAARVNLLLQIETALRDNVYYVDTDCLIVNEAGKQKLWEAGWVRPYISGYLSERWGPEPVDVRGLKYYVHGDRVVCSGVPVAEAQKLLHDDRYKGTVTPLEEIKRRRRPTGAKIVRGFIRYADYQHGIVGADGRVTPHTLVS